MKLLSCSFLVLLGTLLPLSVAAQKKKGASPAKPRPPIGQVAPNFTLADLKGRELVLRDLRADSSIKREGRIVVLLWWSATGPAVAKIDPVMNRLFKKYSGKGVRFFAINPFVCKDPDRKGTESLEIIREFKRIRRIQFPVLLDWKKKVSRRYRARHVPEVVVIDRQGALRYRGAVVTPLKKAGERQYRPYLEDALRAVLAGKMVPLKETRTWGNIIPY